MNHKSEIPQNSEGENPSPEEPLWISEEMLEDAPQNTPVDFERGMSYFAPLTLALITANIVVFIWQLAVGALLSKEAIIASGALEREHLLQGEVWRLFSPMFLHGSFDHLIGNCLALYTLGIASEHAFGSLRTASVYFLSGLCGSLLSVIVQPGPSVGASGAIFGLMALISLFFYRYQKLFFLRDRRIGFVIALWGFYTIITGFLTPQVDNFAHLGGAIGGGITLGFHKPKVLRKTARVKGDMEGYYK